MDYSFHGGSGRKENLIDIKLLQPSVTPLIFVQFTTILIRKVRLESDYYCKGKMRQMINETHCNNQFLIKTVGLSQLAFINRDSKVVLRIWPVGPEDFHFKGTDYIGKIHIWIV